MALFLTWSFTHLPWNAEMWQESRGTQCVSLCWVVSAKRSSRADPACGARSSVPCCGFVMSSQVLVLHFCVCIYTVEPWVKTFPAIWYCIISVLLQSHTRLMLERVSRGSDILTWEVDVLGFDAHDANSKLQAWGYRAGERGCILRVICNWLSRRICENGREDLCFYWLVCCWDISGHADFHSSWKGV